MVTVIRHSSSIQSITGEDSEWTTNEDVVGDHTSTTATTTCDVKTEQQQQEQPQLSSSSSSSSPPSRPTTAEPEESPAAADAPPKLRLNPNLATDPARWSPANEPSPQPPPPPPPLLPPATSSAAAASSSSSSTSSSSSSSSSSATEISHNVVSVTTPRAIQIFICNPCGIRFSSLSTLDAHQTYYCSRRHKKDSESDDVKLPTMVIDSDEMVLGNDTDSRPSSVEPSAKSARTGKQYKCPHCSYSADKKVSLNRHMRMHSISPVSMQSPPCSSDAADPSVVDRYCQNCDIRFSNLRTYQAHKTHYCNTRHVVKPTPSSSPVPSNNPSPTSVPTYLALPTNPVIVVPYTLVQNASVLSALSTDIGPPPPTDTACIVLSDGTLQPIAQALVPTKFNVIANNNENIIPRDNSQSPPEPFFSPPKKSETINQPEIKRPAVQPSSPLDLRLKRVSFKSSSQQDIGGGGGGTDGEEEKENRRCSDGNITDAEDIVCAPSIPYMILSPSSSPPTRNKTPQPHHQHHHQRPPGSVQPAGLCNGAVPLQKPQTPPEAERNGKFSVSSLLHVKQEPVPSPVAVMSRYSGHHHLAAAMQHKPHGRGASLQPPTTAVVSRGDMLGPAAALPYFTPEMTLRLAAAAAAAAAASSNSTVATADGLAPTHQFYLKQGPSKCESCNIVFCKYENFLAHKKHYCASRPPQPLPPQQQHQQHQHQNQHQQQQQHGDADDAVDKTSPEGSPGPKPLTVSSPLSSKDSVSPTPVQLKPPMIQFICSTCGVKFSSFDNLTTHQSYYCPNRATTAVAVGGQQDPATLHHLQQLQDKSLLSKCPKCKMIVDGSLLHQHQCQAANCWKCPVCGAVCSTASAAQKHLDNHNGIRAFVCTICQYKGNTLRGLRTHIRMHFNKRLIPDLMEEDYVSCLIDENSAASSTSVAAAVADAGAAKTPTIADADCKPPLAMMATPAAATAVVVLDDDEPAAKESVIVKQEPQQPSNGTATPGGAAEPHESAAGAHHLPQPLPQDLAAAGAQDGDPQPSAAKRGPMTTKYCKACDISFNYLSTFIAHKKYYCRNSTEYKTCNTDNAKTATVT